MKKEEFLINYQKIADIQASRLSIALEKVSPLFSLNVESLKQLKDEGLDFLDMATTRFGKLQD